MEKTCDYYLSVVVAQRILRDKDSTGEGKIATCLYNKREDIFKRVPRSSSKIAQDLYANLLEDAYSDAVMLLLDKGRKGALFVDGDNLLPYFFGIFKFTFLSSTKKQYRIVEMLDVAENRHEAIDDEREKVLAAEYFRQLVQKAMVSLGDTQCRELLTDRYIKSLTYDEMVDKRMQKITRETAINITYRCKERFRKIWKTLKKE